MEKSSRWCGPAVVGAPEAIFPAQRRQMVWEEKPKSVKEAFEMVNIKLYELACKAEGVELNSRSLQKPMIPTPSRSSGSSDHPNSKPAVGVQRSKTNYKWDIQSWKCKKIQPYGNYLFGEEQPNHKG